MRKFYSLEEIAEQLGVTYQLVYCLVRTGEMSAGRIRKVYHVSDLDLETYLGRQRDSIQKEVQALTCTRCGKTFLSASHWLEPARNAAHRFASTAFPSTMRNIAKLMKNLRKKNN